MYPSALGQAAHPVVTQQPLQNLENNAPALDEEMSTANEIGSHLIHNNTLNTAGDTAAPAHQETQEFSASPVSYR